MDERPIIRKLIDAIHDLQAAQPLSVHERSARWVPAWPACVSRTPRFGTAIAPRQAVYAMHYPLSVGGKLRFGDEERTITKTTPVAGDIGIAEWGQPITATPMKLLPHDWQRFISTDRRIHAELVNPLRCWRCDQGGEVLSNTVSILSGMFQFVDSTHNGIDSGDSGGPVWIGGRELVLLGCVSTRNGGPSLAANLEKVLSWAPEAKTASWEVAVV